MDYFKSITNAAEMVSKYFDVELIAPHSILFLRGWARTLVMIVLVE